MTKHLPKVAMSEQLKDSCRFSHTNWAAWLEPVGGAWVIQCQSGINKARLEWLQSLLQEKSTIVWLAGALSNRRRRYRETGRQAHLAGCKFLFIFPNAARHQLLLVGTDSMEKNNEAFWRVIAMQPSEQVSHPSLPQAPSVLPVPNVEESAYPIDLHQAIPEALRQLQVLKDNAQELTKLAQRVTSISEQDASLCLDEPIQALFQHFVRQSRLLLGANYAQLGWIDKKPPLENIPLALDKGNPVLYHTILSDSDSDGTNTLSSQSNRLSLIHTYIATLSESFLVNDFPAWAGFTENLQSLANDNHLAIRIDPDAADFRCRSVIGIPLHFHHEIAGTLLIFDDRPDKSFTHQDLALLELVAPQIEIAIGYAQLNTRLQERITAQNLAESRLVRSARLAAVGEMAAGVAHELNNPLTTVTGFVELVLNELPLGSPLHDDLDLALKEALRARSIVRGLLDFSRPSQDQRIPTDLNDLISQVLNLIRHMLRMNNLSIRLELWDDLPLVTVDPHKIEQVLHNLMQNAIRAMPSGGILTVRTARSKKPNSEMAAESTHWVSILVQDTGVGIPAGFIDRIFEPFYTLQTTDGSDEPGVGLGLAVSYGIIQNHGGSIEVESKINQGSSFTVYLPLRE